MLTDEFGDVLMRLDEKDLEKMIRWESLRATLLGKFYEPIVAGYFKSKGYKVYCESIAVHVRSLESVEEAEKGFQELYEDKELSAKLGNQKLEEIKEKIKNRIEEDKKKTRYNPDLVVEKNGKYYIVEMQVWPVWLKQRFGKLEFTWDVVLNENTALIPRVFATKVKVNGKEHDVAGFYYVTFSRSGDHDIIERFSGEITRREFNFFT